MVAHRCGQAQGVARPAEQLERVRPTALAAGRGRLEHERIVVLQPVDQVDHRPGVVRQRGPIGGQLGRRGDGRVELVEQSSGLRAQPPALDLGVRLRSRVAQPGNKRVDLAAGRVTGGERLVRACRVERLELAQDGAAGRRQVRSVAVELLELGRERVDPRLRAAVGRPGQLRPLDRVLLTVGGHGQAGATERGKDQHRGPPHVQLQAARRRRRHQDPAPGSSIAPSLGCLRGGPLPYDRVTWFGGSCCVSRRRG